MTRNMSGWFDPLPLSLPGETQTPASSISANRPFLVCFSPAVGQWEIFNVTREHDAAPGVDNARRQPRRAHGSCRTDLDDIACVHEDRAVGQDPELPIHGEDGGVLDQHHEAGGTRSVWLGT
jgi:hypothetical protein